MSKEVYPKFIIEDGNLIIGMVKFHKELSRSSKMSHNMKGGGWFRSERNNITKLINIIFFGQSEDFGKASFDAVRQCVENKKVFDSVTNFQNISQEYDFYYEIEGEKIKLNS